MQVLKRERSWSVKDSVWSTTSNPHCSENGQTVSGVQVSVDFNEKTKKFDVYVGEIDCNSWKRVPRLFVKKALSLHQPLLGMPSTIIY